MQHIDLQINQFGLKSWHNFVFLYFYVGKESLSSFQSSQSFGFFLLDNIQFLLFPKIFISLSSQNINFRINFFLVFDPKYKVKLRYIP